MIRLSYIMDIQPFNRSLAQRGSNSNSSENIRNISDDSTSKDRAASIRSDDDSIFISNEGIEKLNQAQTEERDQFLQQSRSLIFSTVLSGGREYPENLASRLDRDSSLSTEDRSQIANALNQREFDAFGKYAKQSPPDLESYYENYIRYLDSLSPEEQSSERYSGQREQALLVYRRINSDTGNSDIDLTEPEDPILSLLEILSDLSNEDNADSRIENFLEETREGLNLDDLQTPVIQNAISQIELVQTVIEQARNGDTDSYNQLQKLVSNELSTNEFLSLYQ